jgi:hypothetical protein
MADKPGTPYCTSAVTHQRETNKNPDGAMARRMAYERSISMGVYQQVEERASMHRMVLIFAKAFVHVDNARDENDVRLRLERCGRTPHVLRRINYRQRRPSDKLVTMDNWPASDGR